MSESLRSGLVMSGGGARGAYEVGLVAGIIDVLELTPRDPAPFQIFAGTSVGAINAAYLAAYADRGDMAIEGLVDAWKSLRLNEHLRFDPMGILGLRGRLPFSTDTTLGRSLLDPRPLHDVVRETVDWERLHANVKRGVVHALIVTALHIRSGRTHMFAEVVPGCHFRPSRDPRRRGVCGPISADHVLASSALPLIFPAHKIGAGYYCDGGLRFNTPLSPAIRAGADRLVVIPLLRGFRPSETGTELYPNPFFLLGKLLAALLLDPIEYDLKVLERINDIVGTLDDALSEEERARFQEVVIRARGNAYRKLDTLALYPTDDIGRMAGVFLNERDDDRRSGLFAEQVIRRAAMMKESMEADLVSFLLFDGDYAGRLIELGRRDAQAKAEEICAFFRRGGTGLAIGPSQ
ncbi:MAG: patatin-like phospholipase family protein [Myxococcota bacterium]